MPNSRLSFLKKQKIISDILFAIVVLAMAGQAGGEAAQGPQPGAGQDAEQDGAR